MVLLKRASNGSYCSIKRERNLLLHEQIQCDCELTILDPVKRKDVVLSIY